MAVRKGLPNLFGSIPTRSCLPMSFGKRAVALGERGRQWAGVEDARHAAGPRGPRDQVHGGAILRFALTASISAILLCLVLNGSRRPPRTDRHPLVIDTAILLTLVAINPFAVESISLADDVNQNNRPDFDLVPLFGPPTFRGNQGF